MITTNQSSNQQGRVVQIIGPVVAVAVVGTWYTAGS